MSVRYVSRGNRVEMIGRKCLASVSLIERLFVILQFCVVRVPCAAYWSVKNIYIYTYIMTFFKEWFSLVENVA